MKGILPTWIAHLVGVDTADSGEGTAWALDYTWSWAPWVTLLLVVAVAAFVAFCYVREGGSAGRVARVGLTIMRLTAFAIVLFMIAQFVLSLKRTGLPYLVVAIDDSASMNIADRYDDEQLRSLIAERIKAAGFDKPTRLNLAKSLLLEDDGALLYDIQDRYKLRLYFVSDAARGQSGDVGELQKEIRALEPTGVSSRLGLGVRSILNDLRGTPPTAIILLTDGVNTEGEALSEAATLARRKGVPLFAVALGDDRPVRDLELTDLLVDEVVFVDDVVNFEFKLSGPGLPGRKVEVVLKEKNKAEPLARTTVTIGENGQPQKVRLPYRPTKVGDFDYVIEVQNLPEEIRADNNRQERLVSVRKEQIRVLLVQSYPSYEFRYLKHLLERDGTVELKTFLQDADPGYTETDKSALRAFPVRRDDLFAYDVLIFGDVDPTFLGASVMDNIAAFVTEKGGGMVVISGPRYTPAEYGGSPLAKLMPVELEGVARTRPATTAGDAFQVQPTELGLVSPTMQLGDTPEQTREIWAKLPPLYWMFESSQLKPGARVLAEHPVRTGSDGQRLPIICLQYVGAGKVLFHAVDETWRWRYRVGDVFFARYWVQTIRYLSRSKLLGKDRSAELTTDRREYRQGEPVRLRVRFIDERLAPAGEDGVTLVVEQEGEQNRRLTLQRTTSNRGVFEGVLSDAPQGRFHAWLASPTLEGSAPSADFLVAAPPGEFERVQMDASELKRASGDTKGRFYTIATASKLRGDLPEGRQVPIESLPPIALWNQWPLLFVLLSLLVGEWFIRKRKGML